MSDDRTGAATGAGANLAALRAAYARWDESKGAEPDGFVALMDEAIEMRSVLSPDLPDDLAAYRVSRPDAEAYFEVIARDWEMLAFDVDRFIADAAGDEIVMVGRCHWRHRATGREVDSPKVDIWEFRGGKACRFLEMFDSHAFMRAVGEG